MKRVITLFNRILLLLAISCLSMSTFAQTTVEGGPINGPCGNLYYKITTTGSPCMKNGKIKIDLWGPDVEGADPNLSAVQYKAYLTGTDGDKEFFVNDNELEGKEAGTYTVEIIGQCKDLLGGKEALKLSETVVVEQLNGWSYLSMKRETANSFTCANTGYVKLSNVKGGLPPYSIKFTKKPDGYLGSETIFSGNTLPSNGIIEIKGLPPGDYEITFTEGSACGQTIVDPFTITSLALPPTSMFFSWAYPGQYGVSSPGPDSEYHNKLALSYRGDAYNDNYKFFMEKKAEYFEYAIYYGTGTPTMASLSWSPFDFTGSYFYVTMPHTVSEMWTVGTSTKRPRIFIRPTGCTEMIEPSYNLYTPNPYTSISYADCGIGTFRFYPRYVYYGIYSYPVTWKFTNKADNSVVAQSAAPIPYANGGNSIYINNLATGSYNLAITDANGYTKNNTVTISGNTPVNDASSYPIQFGCYDEYAPSIRIYNSNTTVSLKDIDSIVYLKTEKYNNATSNYVADPTFPAPRFPKVKISDISVDSLNKYYSRYFCPWATSLDNTIITTEGTLTSTWDPSTGTWKYTTNTQLLKNKLEYPYSPNTYYKHDFRILDTCGKYRDVSIYSSSTYYGHTGVVPQFITERPCIDDKARVIVSNMESLMTETYRQTGDTYPRSYYGYIDKYPTGATVQYYSADGTTKSYISANTDYMIVDKPGTYTFTASPRTWGIVEGLEDMYCAQRYEFTIHEIPQFELDDVNTAMYRCPGSALGQAHIEVAVKNGMGPYKFELQDDDRTVLATNETGIFASGTWSSTKNSDYYWIVGYDYGCGRATTFEKRIKVYDLDNENSAWSYKPNVCVGDSIILHVLALGTTDYNWEFYDENGLLQATYEGRRVAIPNAQVSQSGKYVSIVSIPGCSGAIKRDTVEVSVGERLMYWRTDATDSNWFNKNNWWKVEDGALVPVKTIPALCTTVHIPGNATNYPNLSIWENFGYPACDTIIYHYGAETAYPGYLKYSRAKIQYNMGYYSPRTSFGAQPTLNADTDYPGNSTTPTKMDRARWYMLSTPLKQMTGGDFGLAGYPKMYQRLFNTTRSEAGKPMQDGFSKTFNNYTIPTAETGNALALWIPDYDDYLGSRDQKYLQNLKGIIEIPYIYDEGVIKANRPLHKFEVNGTDSISYFYYFDGLLDPVMSQFDMMKRGYQSFRFVFEDTNNSKVQEKIGSEYITIYRMSIPGSDTGGRIMIGNPIMSSIDFDKIYALNNTIIKNHYQVVTENGEILEYAIGSPLNDLTKLNKSIPPLQAFIIERTNPTSNDELLFHLDGSNAVMSVAAQNTPHPKPKSEMAPPEGPSIGESDLQGHIIVDCIAKGATSSGQDFSSRAGVMFNYPNQTNSEMSVFDEDLATRADVFFTDSDGYLYRSLVKNDTPKPSILRFGLQSKFFGTIELPITYSGEIIKTVKFVDTYTNTTVNNIQSGWIHSFTHRDINENGVRGLDTKRFELHIEYADNTTGLHGESNSNNLSINYFNKTLTVDSNIPISQVTLTTLAGVAVFGDMPNNPYSYKKEVRVEPGVYIVQAVLENGETKTSKIIVQ